MMQQHEPKIAHIFIYYGFLFVVLGLILVGLLAACSSRPVSPAACPPLRAWTPKQEQQIAAARRQLPADSALNAVLLEWAFLRGQARACQAARP